MGTLNCTSHFGECNFSSLKNAQVQINSKLNVKTTWLLINNITWQNFCGACAKRSFLKSFFSHSRNLFFKVLICKTFVIILHDIIGLENSYCLSASHNPELQCVICTGVSLELHCSKPIRIEYFFSYILLLQMYTILLHACPWIIMLCASQTDLYNTLNSNKSSPSNQTAICISDTQ